MKPHPKTTNVPCPSRDRPMTWTKSTAKIHGFVKIHPAFHMNMRVDEVGHWGIPRWLGTNTLWYILCLSHREIPRWSQATLQEAAERRGRHRIPWIQIAPPSSIRSDGNPSGDLLMESHEVQNYDCVVGSPDALSFPYHLHRLLRTSSQRIPITLQ